MQSVSVDWFVVCQVQIDCQQLTELLTKLAAKRGCKNRACIHRLLGRSLSLKTDKQCLE